MLILPADIETPPTKKAKAAKKKEDAVAIVEEGMVIYADAGCRPNPGFGGWGLHGYTYSTVVPKKGSGNPSVSLTAKGYVPKSEKENLVTPINYLDAYGTINYITNNGGELLAATNGMEYAAKHPIKDLTIITDSKYVVTGAMDYLPKWKKNDWKKADGTEISNVTYWQQLDKQLLTLREMNINVSLQWVKGHNGNVGNELADKHATIGVLTSTKGIMRGEKILTNAATYWSGPEDKHPLLTLRRIYFTTSRENTVPGEYYLGEHGKEDDLLGTRTADGAYAYLLLTTPDPYIELMRNKQISEATNTDAIIMGRLDRLFSASVRTDIERFGDAVLYRSNKNKLDLFIVDNLDSDQLTKELNPPRIAIRAVEAVNALKGILLDFEDNPVTAIIATDITHELYDMSNKKEYKLLPRFVAGFTDLELTGIKYSSIGDIATKTTVGLTLTMGIDLPERNALKRIEKLVPTVQLLTWHESDLTLRYVTHIVLRTETGHINAVGIWAGYYSNFKYLTEKK